jgi:RNA polymerase sigma factor (sigma-70 family)
MNSGRTDESLEQLFGRVFDLAGQFAMQISQDDIETRLRRTLQKGKRPAAIPQVAPSSPAGQPVAALLGRAAAGNREAWNQIVDRYAPLVHSICRHYRLTDQDSGDVAQNVWLLLLERIGTLRDPAALPGWLATTTRRECGRVLGRVRRAGAMPPEDPTQDDATIDAEILAAERNAALQVAFARLPLRCQQLLAMLMADPPCPYADISAALNIPVGSIGPQRARCVDRLRAMMGDEPDHEPDRASDQ